MRILQLVLLFTVLAFNFPQRPAIVTIERPETYQRIIAISDMHGMHKQFATLLRVNGVTDKEGRWIAGRTLFIVIGDFINKGPESLKIMDMLISLETEALKQGGRVITLLGNHEAELLAAPHGLGHDESFAQELNGHELSYDDLISPLNRYGHFLRSLPGYAKVGPWIFFHSGYMPKGDFSSHLNAVSLGLSNGDYANSLFIGSDSFLKHKTWWEEKFEENVKRVRKAGFYGVVFGHRPKAFGSKKIIRVQKRVIKIDTGMAPDSGSRKGEMLLFKNPRDMVNDIFAIDSKGKHRLLD